MGSTKHTQEHFINMEGVIPNSKVVIIPPIADDGTWRKELYLRPGEWIPWVTVTMVATTIVLAITVFVLHLNEKVSKQFIYDVTCSLIAGFVESGRVGEEKGFAPYQFRCAIMRGSEHLSLHSFSSLHVIVRSDTRSYLF